MQLLTEAGPVNTGSLLNGKQSSVCGALNKLSFVIEKLVLHPFQWNALMGAAVEVAPNFVCSANQEDGLSLKLELPAVALRQFTQPANRRHD